MQWFENLNIDGQMNYGIEAVAKKARTYNTLDGIIHLLHRAGQLADEEFMASLGGNGLTARQFVVMSVVARQGTPSQTEICDLSGIDRSTLADIVRRLVARGLLARRRTREDARMYAVRLTETGEKALADAAGAARHVDQAMLGVLSAPQRAEFESNLRRMVEELQVRRRR
jgi:DNA-binding MarR family transcriptional regulator